MNLCFIEMARLKSGPQSTQQRAVALKLQKQLTAKRSSQNSSANTLNVTQISSTASSVPPVSRNGTGKEIGVKGEAKRFEAEPDSDSEEDRSKVEYTARDGVIRKRFRPCLRALREITYFQNQSSTTIPKAAFARLAREVLCDLRPRKELKWTIGSLLGLQVRKLVCIFYFYKKFRSQEGAECFLVNMMENANIAAIHGKRVTIMPRDMDLVGRIRKRAGFFY